MLIQTLEQIHVPSCLDARQITQKERGDERPQCLIGPVVQMVVVVALEVVNVADDVGDTVDLTDMGVAVG